MMKNISCFKTLAVKLLGNIKIANVFHHPVQAEVMIFNLYIYMPYQRIKFLPAGYIKNAIVATSGLGIGRKKAKNFVLSDNMLCAYFLNHFWGIIRHQKHMEIEVKIVINSMLLPCYKFDMS